MVRVKICGITNRGDAHAAVDAGADALGFIFVRESPRYIEPHIAAGISAELAPFVSVVGVFADESREVVAGVRKMCCLNAVQLHGNESPEYCRDLSCAVIKAFRMADDFDLGTLEKYQVRGFLLDTAVEGKLGGTGLAFDWRRAVPAKKYGPVILAGGLNPENVAEAVKTVRPYGVDVSSGVEGAPGKKDHEKIRKLITLCK
jgi:phosphoribosylanthranilate isomerase